MKRLFTPIKGFIFPLVVFLLEKSGASPIIALMVTALAIAWFSRRSRFRHGLLVFMVVTAIVVALTRFENLPRLYPFLLAFSFFILFLNSFRGDKRILEAFAARSTATSPFVAGALKDILPLWVGGLGLNALVLFVFLFYFPTSLWVLYASVVSYLWLGLLFAITFISIYWRHGLDLQGLVYSGKILVAFVVFGLTCLLLSGILPFIFLCSRFSRHRREHYVRRFCQLGFRFILRLLEQLGCLDLDLADADSLDGRIIIANHISMLDVVFILSRISYCHFFVNSKFFRNPVLAPIIRAAGFIPISHDRQNHGVDWYEKARQIILNGGALMVFPEGTRALDGRLQEFKKGVFKLAVECNQPIYTLMITSDKPFLNKAQLFHRHNSSVKIRLRRGELLPLPTRQGKVTRNDIIGFRDNAWQVYREWLEGDLALDWNRLHG